MIQLEQLEEMFENIANGPKWNMNGPMLWGYFFTDETKEKLERLSEELQLRGYQLVELFEADADEDEEPYYFLHVEKEEIHSPTSLNKRNVEFYSLADHHHLRKYDGMDVGPCKSQ